MSEIIPLDKAWRLLGRDPAAVAARVAALPRERRVGALREAVEEAKKLARALMAKHHPDRGGDPSKFRLAKAALESIEHHTDEYARKSEERAKQAEERAARRGPVIKVG